MFWDFVYFIVFVGDSAFLTPALSIFSGLVDIPINFNGRGRIPT